MSESGILWMSPEVTEQCSCCVQPSSQESVKSHSDAHLFRWVPPVHHFHQAVAQNGRTRFIFLLSYHVFLFFSFFFFYQFLSLRVNMAVCRCARMCLHARVFWVIKLHRFISCYNTNHSLNNGWALMEGICQTSDVKPQDLALTCSHTETQTHTSGWWVRDRLETDCTDGQRQTYL